MQEVTKLIAQGSLEVASRFRGPPLAEVRENASDFDCRSAYLANSHMNMSRTN